MRANLLGIDQLLVEVEVHDFMSSSDAATALCFLSQMKIGKLELTKLRYK